MEPDSVDTSVKPTGFRPRALLRWFGRAFGVVVVAVCLLVLGLVSLGAAAGRFHAIPVDATGPGVHVPHGSLAIIAPTSPLQLHDGDLVVARLVSGNRNELYKVAVVDSWTHNIFTTNSQGRLEQIKFAGMPARVSETVPHVGVVFQWLAGMVQGVLLLLSGAALLGCIMMQRARRRYEARIAAIQASVLGAQHPAVQQPRRKISFVWTSARVGAGVLATLGILSMTASANFTATTTVSQGAINAGHMGFTLGAASASYRLQTGLNGGGSNYLVPGDIIERTVDLKVDATTSSGIMTGIQLTMGTASNTPGNGPPTTTYYLDDNTANSLRLWILSCTTAWTENGGAPPGSNYTCTGGMGNVADVLGTYKANNGAMPATSPSTCAYTGPVSLHSAESVQTLSGLATSANSDNYLLVLMCLPGTATDTYQDSSIALNFTFNGIQRAATAK
jgi:hypothetical protein